MRLRLVLLLAILLAACSPALPQPTGHTGDLRFLLAR